VLLDTVRPLADAAAAERPASTGARPAPARVVVPQDQPIVAVLDPEMVRAAVTIALDAAMPAMIDEITAKVLVALRTKIS
jgi:hypothetical protein